MAVSAKSGDVDLVWKLTRKKSGLEFALKCEKTRVPILDHSYGMTRRLSPLRHEIEGSSMDFEWTALLRSSEAFEFCKSLLQKELDDTGTLLGQRASWTKYKDLLTSKNISREVLFTAHRVTNGSLVIGEERH